MAGLRPPGNGSDGGQGKIPTRGEIQGRTRAVSSLADDLHTGVIEDAHADRACAWFDRASLCREARATPDTASSFCLRGCATRSRRRSVVARQDSNLQPDRYERLSLVRSLGRGRGEDVFRFDFKKSPAAAISGSIDPKLS